MLGGAKIVLSLAGPSRCSLSSSLSPSSLSFHHSHSHFFRTLCQGLFFWDLFLTMLLTLIIAPPLVAGVTYILIVAGPRMPLYLWCVIAKPQYVAERGAQAC